MKPIVLPTTYALTGEDFENVRDSFEFKDLLAIGRLTNAINFAAVNSVGCQLAKFACERKDFNETIYLTGGLLFDAVRMGERFAERYRYDHFVYDLDRFIESFLDYVPPAVLVDMRSHGPVRICSKDKDVSKALIKLNLHGKNVLFAPLENGKNGYPIAIIADPDEHAANIQRDLDPEVHRDMNSVIELLVSDFEFAAGRFISGLANRIGLETAIVKSMPDMGLAD